MVPAAVGAQAVAMTDVSADDSPADQPNPAPPPRGPRQYRLMRVRRGKVFGGVAGGFARAAGIDPTLARLAVFGACLTGVGLLAYFVLWLVLPQEAPWRNEFVTRAPEPTGLYLRIGLALAGAIGVLNVVGDVGGMFAWGHDHWSYGPSNRGLDFGGGIGLLLIGFAAALLITRRRDRGPDDPDSTTPYEPGSSWTAAPGGGDSPPTDYTAGAYTGREYGSEDYLVEESTPRSLIAARVIGWLVVVWALLASGVGFALWWAGAMRPGVPEVAIPLGVIAFALPPLRADPLAPRRADHARAAVPLHPFLAGESGGRERRSRRPRPAPDRRHAGAQLPRRRRTADPGPA